MAIPDRCPWRADPQQPRSAGTRHHRQPTAPSQPTVLVPLVSVTLAVTSHLVSLSQGSSGHQRAPGSPASPHTAVSWLLAISLCFPSGLVQTPARAFPAPGATAGLAAFCHISPVLSDTATLKDSESQATDGTHWTQR